MKTVLQYVISLLFAILKIVGFITLCFLGFGLFGIIINLMASYTPILYTIIKIIGIAFCVIVACACIVGYVKETKEKLFDNKK